MMNRRLKKKQDKKAIKIAKNIKYIDGKPLSNRTAELVKVVYKCLKDKFPIEKYSLFDVPYRDRSGLIMCFMHQRDYKDYLDSGNRDMKIREIDFWCPYDNNLAIPQGVDKDGNRYNCHTCQEAVHSI